MPHSNKFLVEILPRALKEVEDRDSDWSTVASLPTSTLECWKGQKEILFYDNPLSGFQDVVTVLDRCLRAADIPGLSTSIDRSSLGQVLYGLMVLQKAWLESLQASKSTLADLIHYRFDDGNIPLVCRSCSVDSGSISNHNASFFVNLPNHYVTCGGPKICTTCGKSTKLRLINRPMVE